MHLYLPFVKSIYFLCINRWLNIVIKRISDSALWSHSCSQATAQLRHVLYFFLFKKISVQDKHKVDSQVEFSQISELSAK